MISAKEAKRIAQDPKTLEEIIKMVETAIIQAARIGKYEVTLDVEISWEALAVLQSYGYTVFKTPSITKIYWAD